MSDEKTEAPAPGNDAELAKALAREIADALNEPNIILIKRIIGVLGLERTQMFFREAVEQEAQGGLLRKDGERRTPGGAFFYGVRGNIPATERKLLWPINYKKKAKRPESTPTEPAPAMSWEEAK